MSTEVDTVGLIGAGKLGTTLARLFVHAGIRPLVVGRADPATLRFALDAIAPGAEAASPADVLRENDVTILALPLAQITSLPPVPEGVLIVDATNYWQPTDGAVPAFIDPDLSHSESVRNALGVQRLVKSFNHLGYHDMDLLSAQADGQGQQIAIGVAGDRAADRTIVSRLVRRVGFDPVELPTLAAGRSLESGHVLFGSPVTGDAMRRILD